MPADNILVTVYTANITYYIIIHFDIISYHTSFRRKFKYQFYDHSQQY